MGRIFHSCFLLTPKIQSNSIYFLDLFPKYIMNLIISHNLQLHNTVRANQFLPEYFSSFLSSFSVSILILLLSLLRAGVSIVFHLHASSFPISSRNKMQTPDHAPQNNPWSPFWSSHSSPVGLISSVPQMYHSFLLQDLCNCFCFILESSFPTCSHVWIFLIIQGTIQISFIWGLPYQQKSTP